MEVPLTLWAIHVGGQFQGDARVTLQTRKDSTPRGREASTEHTESNLLEDRRGT